MLFVIAMEALNAMFTVTDNMAMFSPLRPATIKFRASLYEDDLVIFVAPVAQDLCLTRTILDLFVGASRLHTNIHKCQFTPIQCTEDQVQLVKDWFPCQ